QHIVCRREQGAERWPSQHPTSPLLVAKEEGEVRLSHADPGYLQRAGNRVAERSNPRGEHSTVNACRRLLCHWQPSSPVSSCRTRGRPWMSTIVDRTGCPFDRNVVSKT